MILFTLFIVSLSTWNLWNRSHVFSVILFIFAWISYLVAVDVTHMLQSAPKQTASPSTSSTTTTAAWHSGQRANSQAQAEMGLNTAPPLFTTTSGILLCVMLIGKNNKHTHEHINAHKTDFITSEEKKKQWQLCKACHILHHREGEKNSIAFVA